MLFMLMIRPRRGLPGRSSVWPSGGTLGISLRRRLLLAWRCVLMPRRGSGWSPSSVRIVLSAQWQLNACSLRCGGTSVLSLLVMSVVARPKPTASGGVYPNPSSGGLGAAEEERGRAWIGCILLMLGKITGVWNNAEANVLYSKREKTYDA